MDWKRLEEPTRHHGTARVEDARMDDINPNELARLALAGKALVKARRALAKTNEIGPNPNPVFAARDRVDEALAAWIAIDGIENQRRTRSKRSATVTG